MKNPSLLIQDRFFSGAKNLRQEFENHFSNPLETHSKRFVWDYWHVEDQYTFFRTPAYHYFTKKAYEQLHRAILQFGREQLGCFDITPPWLSYYVDGCSQNLHADIPHGPWAFVYSLTQWSRREFRGGETLILKDEILNYWSHFDSFNGLESKQVFHKVPALFNRLVVFDPRSPHGVSIVSGTKDPLQARLVIHGWFKKPEPYVEGGLTRSVATRSLQILLEEISSELQILSALRGALVLRFHVSSSGKVNKVFLPTNNLKGPNVSSREIQKDLRRIGEKIKRFSFPKASKPTRVTLPLIFS
ncbi:MAG: hypothetical protein AB7F59_13580 [Bdellovibrionales bacterium]